MAGVVHDLTGEEWDALIGEWGGCAYCQAAGGPLQRDCVLAISRGGRYTLANVVPACRSCNTSKCNWEVTAWMRRKRLDERRFLLAHLDIASRLERHFAPPGTIRPADWPGRARPAQSARGGATRS